MEPLTKADKIPKPRRLTPLGWLMISVIAALLMALSVVLLTGE